MGKRCEEYTDCYNLLYYLVLVWMESTRCYCTVPCAGTVRYTRYDLLFSTAVLLICLFSSVHRHKSTKEERRAETLSAGTAFVLEYKRKALTVVGRGYYCYKDYHLHPYSSVGNTFTLCPKWLYITVVLITDSSTYRGGRIACHSTAEYI